ncbi:MAG: hypothetical protein ACRDQ6_16305 [Pseudonocardiaceae bacterium]
MVLEPAVLAWLLDADVALRWQVERDLVGAPQEVWGVARARIATDGFGARLLALHGSRRAVGRRILLPAELRLPRRRGSGGRGAAVDCDDVDAQHFTRLGLDATALTGTADLLAANSGWNYSNLPCWGGEVDCCINAYTLANGAWLGVDVSGIAQ